MAEHIATVPKWEYQVTRMEQMFNAGGAQGGELIAINEERATFKRPPPPTM